MAVLQQIQPTSCPRAGANKGQATIKHAEEDLAAPVGKKQSTSRPGFAIMALTAPTFAAVVKAGFLDTSAQLTIEVTGIPQANLGTEAYNLVSVIVAHGSQ